MTSSKYILLGALWLQLSTCTFSQSATIEDAQLALEKLDNQIGNSTILVSETVPNIWKSYVNIVNETVHQDLLYDIGNFTALLYNLTDFSALVINGAECILDLGKYFYIDSYNVDVVTSQDLVYKNLLSLAYSELGYVVDQFGDLTTDFNKYCVKNTTNCEGTSTFIVAEVERLTQITRRIPYDLLAETHLLGYRLDADWALSQANINIEYNKVIQIATTCLALKLEKFRGEPHGTNIQTENDKSISDPYVDLLLRSEESFTDSVSNLLNYTISIIQVGEAEFESTVFDVRKAIFKVNQTMISLNNFAQDLNITVNCTNLDLPTLLSSLLSTGLNEYSRYLDASTTRHREGLNYLTTTFEEVFNIDFQVTNCTSSTNSCDSIYEKLNKKMTEIPSLLQGRGNATAVLQHQFVTAIRESGYKIVRDVYDRLEAPVVLLKDCVRGYLYDED